MTSVISQLELVHIFIAEHVKLDHHQLLQLIGIIIIVTSAITIQHAIWNKAKSFVGRTTYSIINKMSKLGDLIDRAFQRHHDSLFNSKYQRRQKAKIRRASTSFITNRGRVARKRGGHSRIRALIMIAIARKTRSNSFKLQASKIGIRNDDQMTRINQIWSDKNTELEAGINDIIANHAITDDNCIKDDKLLAYSISFCKATPEMCKMDIDSFAIGIDSYASRCISPFIKDFAKVSLRPLVTNKSVKPFGQGKGLNITMIGTLIWRFQDDNGVSHTFKIRNSLLVPDGSMRLLSPQYFAANCESDDVCSTKTSATQFWNRNVMTWGRIGEYKKTVYNSRLFNVPKFFTTPSTDQFVSYAAECDDTVKNEYVVFASEEDNQKEESTSDTIKDTDHEDKENIFDLLAHKDVTKEIENIPDDNSQVEASTPEAEFMRWHY